MFYTGEPCFWYRIVCSCLHWNCYLEVSLMSTCTGTAMRAMQYLLALLWDQYNIYLYCSQVNVMSIYTAHCSKESIQYLLVLFWDQCNIYLYFFKVNIISTCTVLRSIWYLRHMHANPENLILHQFKNNLIILMTFFFYCRNMIRKHRQHSFVYWRFRHLKEWFPLTTRNPHPNFVFVLMWAVWEIYRFV